MAPSAKAPRFPLVPLAALQRAQGELASMYVRLGRLEVAVREAGLEVGGC